MAFHHLVPAYRLYYYCESMKQYYLPKFASGETVIWNKGKTGVYNEETLEKMRGSKSDTHVENMRKSFKDRDISNMGRHKRTEAMKQKQREAAKKQWTPQARAAHSKRMKEVRKANSFSS